MMWSWLSKETLSLVSFGFQAQLHIGMSHGVNNLTLHQVYCSCKGRPTAVLISFKLIDHDQSWTFTDSNAGHWQEQFSTFIILLYEGHWCNRHNNLDGNVQQVFVYTHLCIRCKQMWWILVSFKIIGSLLCTVHSTNVKCSIHNVWAVAWICTLLNITNM